MFNWLKDLLNPRRKICEHKLNYVLYRYVSNDGCPMVNFICKDCGYRDHGPVIAPEIPEDWEIFKIVKHGKVISERRN